MRVRLVAAALAVACALPSAARGAPADPIAPGPYPVGVTRLTATYTSSFSGERPITIEVWYPAAASAAGQPLEAVFDAVRDAPHAGGRFPLLVFSHGSGGIRFQSVPYTRHLATHGFIVAAPDHYGNTLGNNTQSLATLAFDRPRDVSFVLDQLLDAATVPAILRGHIDPLHIGITGHSFGGYTSVAVATDAFNDRDPRVKASVPLAPALFFVTPAILDQARIPFMIMGGTLDTVTPFVANQLTPYGGLGTPKYLIEITDGVHLTFSNACGAACADDQVNGYATAFFKTYLMNDDRFEPLLQAGAEAQFPNVVYRRERGPALLPGGGPPATDCAVELAVPTIPDVPGRKRPRMLSCVDGTACDVDPAPGACGFDVQLCVNQFDRHVSRCTPSDVAFVGVEDGGDAELSALAGAVAAIVPTDLRRCSTPTRVTIGLPSGAARARRKIRTTGAPTAGAPDVDRFTLVCQRP